MNKTYSVLAVEDEPHGLEVLVDYINAYPELKLSGVVSDGNAALDKLKEQKFDIVFLDIMLPGLDGIEILSRLDTVPCVIFTTAHDTHALNAFELGAADFLLKPFSQERFRKAVERAIQSLNISPRRNSHISQFGLFIRSKERQYFVAYEEIVYISSDGKHSVVHTRGGDIESTQMIKIMEERLPEEIFQRIHRKYLVNMRFISHIEFVVGGSYQAFLKDDEKTQLPIGRKYSEQLRDV